MVESKNRSGVAAIVLAAGMSRRMGTPKQLLRLGGKTILQHTLENVRASVAAEIVLVLGHEAETVGKEIVTNGIKVVRNQEYQQGMGTSLRTGLTALSPDTKAALIVLADQPFVGPETLNQLIACHQKLKPQIVIPTYNGFRGNPVLLDRSVFAELQGLSGDVGCRAIFGNHTENIHKLAVGDIGILLDIDSQEEYQKLKGYAVQRNEPKNQLLPPLESKEGLCADRAELIIAGRDAEAHALARFGCILNFTVTVVDPLLALAEWPEADRILHVLDFSLLPSANERFVVVASRGLFDEEAIDQALQVNATHIALLANKKRADEIARSLKLKSHSAEKLAGIHAPAGLDIGAESPEEIALSIMAEIVAERRSKVR